MTGKIEVSFNKRDYEPFFSVDTYGNPSDAAFIGKAIVVFEIPAEIEAQIIAYVTKKQIEGQATLVKEVTGHAAL